MINAVPYLNAGYPCLYVSSIEQERAMSDILDDLTKNRLLSVYTLFIWKITTGLYPFNSVKPENDVLTNPTEGLLGALKFIRNSDDGVPHADRIYFLFNVKEMLNQPAIRQQFRDTAYALRTKGSHIICIGGSVDVPEELEEMITFVDYQLPSKEQLREKFTEVLDKYKDSLSAPVTEKLLDMAAENASGLTGVKAENAVALSIATSRGVDIEVIRKEKQAAVKQSGVLEYIPHSESIDTLGGFDVLKDHVSKRRAFFEDHQKALDFGLKPPKGIMLVGLPGTGKSLAGKSISSNLDLPLYRLDVGALFKGVVGQSEQAARQALKLIDAIAPAVIIIDEMEKLFAGLESSGKSDSGVTSRVVGSIMTWMQETTSPIYKVATCNTIRNLDAALFRRGRWDAVFGVDLPVQEEREAIFNIHLQKRGRDPKKFDLTEVVRITDGFVGAEIESVVDEALYVAFDAGRELGAGDLVRVAAGIIPISQTDKESIASFRDWMSSRATPVSSVTTEKRKSENPNRNIRVQ